MLNFDETFQCHYLFSIVQWFLAIVFCILCTIELSCRLFAEYFPRRISDATIVCILVHLKTKYSLVKYMFVFGIFCLRNAWERESS